MARRRKPGDIVKPLDAAFNNLNAVERAVASTMVDVTFSVWDMAHWLWPLEIVEKLSDAFPYTKSPYKINAQEKVIVPCNGALSMVCDFNINLDKCGMCCPDTGHVSMQPGHDNIIKTLKNVYDIHLKFEQVRRVLRWLNNHATLGATRNYFPSVVALLPTTHAIHQVHGNNFREPIEPMGTIAADMREAGLTMASALLCQRDHPSKRDVVVTFMTTRTDTEPGQSGSNMSDYFGLI